MNFEITILKLNKREVRQMKKFLVLAFSAIIMFSLVNKANATILTFDDITTKDLDTFYSYGNLSWNNAGVVKNSYHSGSGYDKGTISPSYVAFNEYAYDMTVNAINSQKFTFNDAYFTSAWYEPNDLTVTAYLGDNIVGSKTVTLNTQQPQLISFNYKDIDKLLFHSSNFQFVMDNIRINEPVPTPEPSSMVLGLLGLGSLFGFKKRNKQVTVA
jgi:hypothetical protein